MKRLTEDDYSCDVEHDGKRELKGVWTNKDLSLYDGGVFDAIRFVPGMCRGLPASTSAHTPLILHEVALIYS